jgi:hypothetical protein
MFIRERYGQKQILVKHTVHHESCLFLSFFVQNFSKKECRSVITFLFISKESKIKAENYLFAYLLYF